MFGNNTFNTHFHTNYVSMTKPFHLSSVYMSIRLLSQLCSPLNDLQIGAVLVLRFRWFYPGAMWETAKAIRWKGGHGGVTEDVNPSGRAAQPDLVTHRHGLGDVAVVPTELPLSRPVEATVTDYLQLHKQHQHHPSQEPYKPVPHAGEAVSNNRQARKTLRTPILPQQVVIQGLPTMHQVEERGPGCQTLSFLWAIKQSVAALFYFLASGTARKL